MRWLLFILLLCILSCKSLSEQEKLHQSLEGKWLIVYPDHQLKNGRQEIIYSHIQDSIIALSGLKLITLSENGVFQQMDSAGKKGKWGMTADKIVFVESGGKGFDNFSARYTGYNDGVLQLTEFVEAEEEKIELIWNLKKVKGGAASDLFDAKNNEWRKRPNQPEPGKQIKERLAVMLQYYSDYYNLVTKESSFFIPTRIVLPFKFYQHSMGMRPYDKESFFTTLFFNTQQAEEAWQYLKRTTYKLRNDFPRKKDYVEEYAAFMDMMADEIVKE